jgi:hypothetical protein
LINPKKPFSAFGSTAFAIDFLADFRPCNKEKPPYKKTTGVSVHENEIPGIGALSVAQGPD